MLTTTVTAFVMLYHFKNIMIQVIPFACFIVLKLVTTYLVYEPLKYKDDGRDVISIADFITIHVTFPAINAWVSY